MTLDTMAPLRFDVSAVTADISEPARDPAIDQLVEFFGNKGLDQLKREDREEAWYQDWIDYQAEHGLYAGLLSPSQYSRRGHRFDLRRLARCLEVFAYFSPAHAYSLHVSFLGLFPILLSDNERLKQEAIDRLEAGELFAFAVSEQAHGSDLLANEFTVGEYTEAGANWLRAEGTKFYIGNANAAGLISVLAKKAEGEGAPPTRRSGFVFFALRPGESPGYQNVRKVRTLGIRPAFVGEFEVQNHPVAPSDVISQGREAWDAVFDTVNLGKFLLGFGAVGICAHAFAEADQHLRRRVLYGQPTINMPHLRQVMAVAYARLTAMKHYAFRALDYVQTAGADDRRHLLFSAVQKARVSTEGVKVMTMLSEAIGARGLESQTYFEMALRDAQLIPGLEGSTHINFNLTAQFIDNYFAGSDDAQAPESPAHGADVGENPYLIGPVDRNVKSVRFPDYLQAYRPLESHQNVAAFVKQATAFRGFVIGGIASHTRGEDATGLRIALGRCFSTIVYAQLIAERCAASPASASMIAIMFHALIEDMSGEALRLAALLPPDSDQRGQLERMITAPRTEAADIQAVTGVIAARYDKA